MRKPKKQESALSVPLTDKEINEGVYQMIRRHVGMLSEHVSSVQINATKLNSDGTTTAFTLGSGDIYARRNLAEDWLEHVAKL